MTIKLRVKPETIKLKTANAGNATLNVSQGIPIYPNQYTGATEVTPSATAQTLETRGLMMADNITINPVPSNYGLISWDGTTLTVS